MRWTVILTCVASSLFLSFVVFSGAHGMFCLAMFLALNLVFFICQFKYSYIKQITRERPYRRSRISSEITRMNWGILTNKAIAMNHIS